MKCSIKKNVLLVFRVFLPGLRQKPDEKVDVRPIDVVLGWWSVVPNVVHKIHDVVHF